MSKFQEVVNTLREAKEKIHGLLSDPVNEMHQIRITNNLQRDIDNISLLTGIGDKSQDTGPKPGPATTVAGKPLAVPYKPTKVDITPDQERVEVLKRKVETAWNEFPGTPAKEILKEYEELVIRGVAKKAQMKVTKDNPATLTLAFIQDIKKEIKLVNEKNAKAALSEEVEIDEL